MFTFLYQTLLFLLLSGAKCVVFGETTEYPNENCCSVVTEILKNMTAVIMEIHSKLNKQAEYQEEMKEDLGKTRNSTEVLKTKLDQHMQDLLVHDARLKSHDQLFGTEHLLLRSIYGTQLGPRDCSDIRLMGFNNTGIYRVYPGSDDKRIEADVYCDLNSSKDSWLVFQRRKDGSENFERLYSEYERGFGNLSGEFWLGNEKLSLLTMNRKYKLRVELEDFEGEKRYAEYSNFSVRPATDKYRLTIGGYSGNAGDSLTSHNGMMFTTKDADNDPYNANCAQVYHGAWWYSTCHTSNLNGLYLKGPHTSFADGVNWYTWHGHYYSLKTTEMKIAAVF